MKNNYRIVRWYHGFFCHWCYQLEKQHNWKFLWWSGVGWAKVAGNSLTTYPPRNWDELNITETITLPIGEEPQ